MVAGLAKPGPYSTQAARSPQLQPSVGRAAVSAGEAIKIPAKTVLKFRIAKAMKETALK